MDRALKHEDLELLVIPPEIAQLVEKTFGPDMKVFHTWLNADEVRRVVQISVNQDLYAGVGHFQVQEQVNCCGIGVLTRVSAYDPSLTAYDTLITIAEWYAKKLGYSVLLHTNNFKQKPRLVEAMKARGYRFLQTFYNRKSKRDVFIATKVLE